MSKKKLAEIIGVCTMAIMIIIAITILPSCDSTTPTPPTYGLEFDGEDDYVQVPDSESLKPSEITVSLWFNQKSHTQNQEGLLTKWLHEGDYEGFIVQSKADGAVGVIVSAAGYSHASIYTTANNNTWYHFVATADGSELKLYIDGSLIDSVSVSYAPSTKPMYIGWRDGYNFYSGLISEVHIYNRVLSATEIDDIYRHHDVTDGLVGYWKLDEGSGSIAHDSTANNNHGTLEGNPVWFTGGG